MNYRNTFIVASLVAISSAHSMEEKARQITDFSAQKQLMEARFIEADYNQFQLKNQNTSLEVKSYEDYEQSLYRYYSNLLPPQQTLKIRTPECFKRLKERLSEQYLPEIDDVNDYVGHINYILNQQNKTDGKK
jgi:hypothetical protein